ncbi:MAG TPA: PAS domain-containing protein, partial [Longimicrobiaceae bacterium]|nr:PAS domain-containing protein [Longimicrobiaceae bacterium]
MTLDSVLLLAKRPMEDLSLARSRYLEGDPAPAGVRPVVLSSWQRSVAYGVDPHALRPQAADPDRLARARAASRGLLEAAAPFLELVHETLADEPHLVVLADAEGLVLRALVGPGLPDDLEASNLFEGASWHESAIGCNGVGTALATGEPVILIGPEHFQESYVDWTCIGVPIRGPRGEVRGALDLSVPNEHTHVHTWGWMLSVARGIERSLGRELGSPPGADLAALDQPLQAVRGVFDLLAQQLDLPPTHARFLEDGRAAVEAAEAELARTVSAAARSASEARRELSEILSIYETAPVGLCVLDRELRFVRINERLARINGVPAREHIGRTIREVVPQLAEVAEPLLRRVLETGQPILNAELSGETAAHPGETREWVENYLPLRGETGEVFGINVVVDDVTERRRGEEDLREAYRTAQKAIEERDSVLAVVSHDLRNPLSTILMAASLQTEDITEEKKAVQTG